MRRRNNKIEKLQIVEDRDWMLYKITKDNPLTLHHIVERANGGRNVLRNLAPLTKRAHANLNQMQINHIELYQLYQALFKEIATTTQAPQESHIERMRTLQKVAEDYGYDKE